jgi:hypothetical protein
MRRSLWCILLVLLLSSWRSRHSLSLPLSCILFFYGVSFANQAFGYWVLQGARSMGAKQALGQVLSSNSDVLSFIIQREHFLSKRNSSSINQSYIFLPSCVRVLLAVIRNTMLIWLVRQTPHVYWCSRCSRIRQKDDNSTI